MSSIADEYRAKAIEASIMELATHDAFVGQMYLKLYKHWLELAERVEREDRLTCS
jgi:hypothetical protein